MGTSCEGMVTVVVRFELATAGPLLCITGTIDSNGSFDSLDVCSSSMSWYYIASRKSEVKDPMAGGDLHIDQRDPAPNWSTLGSFKSV